jgi:hypothetical protein
MAVVIAIISLSCQDRSTSIENKKIIRVIFDMNPATIKYTYKGNKKIANPVFSHDPREEITASLKEAGFKVVSQNRKNYDLSLKIIYRERARQRGLYPGDTYHEIMINHIGFVLEDIAGAILLKEGRGPFGSDESMTAVKQSFIKDLVELVQILIEKANETSCWIEFVSRRGDEASVKAIEKAGDPKYTAREEQLILLEPMLRSHKISSRMVSLRLLQELRHTPSSNSDSAAISIVQSYPFHRWSATNIESTSGAWAARQGVIPVIRYGTTAIDLFVEDLKGKRYRGGWGVGGVASRAMAVLMRLSRERWTKFGYAKWASIGRGVDYIDRKPESDFFHVKYFDWGNKLLGEVEVVNPKRASEVYYKVWNQEWNDYAIKKLVEILEKGKNVPIDEDNSKQTGIDNQNYFQAAIEILGEIADSQVIPLLKSYLDHPKLAEDAKKAIKNIEKREK